MFCAIALTQAESKAAKDVDNDVPAEEDNTADPNPRRTGAPIIHTASVPLEQNRKSRTTAAELGTPSVGTVAVAFPLSESVQRLLDAQTQKLSAASSSL